jgi:hypothetical protein
MLPCLTRCSRSLGFGRQISTCGKAFPGTRQDRDANVVPSANFIHGRHHVFLEPLILRVDRWVVHRDDGDVIFNGDFYLTFSHGSGATLGSHWRGNNHLRSIVKVAMER